MGTGSGKGKTTATLEEAAPPPKPAPRPRRSKTATSVEPAPPPKPAPEPVIPSFVPPVVYLVTTHGIIEEWRPSEVYRLSQLIEVQDPNDFLFFSNKKPVYVGKQTKNGGIEPLSMPELKDIETTSISLYAKAVTYSKTLTRLIRRRLKNNKDKTSKNTKFIWVIALIAIVLFIVFMLAVTIISGGKDNSETPTTNNQSSYPKADLTIPTPTPIPAPTPAQGVPIE
jgi:hypothetical protein